MASSSSASSTEYDVFVSFREEDTGRTFTSHLIAKRLLSKRVLIVFDDVTQLTQIEDILRSNDGLKRCFGPWSRVIVTARDKQILSSCRADYILEVLGLPYQEALQLFTKHAFDNQLAGADYMDLSYKAVKYANGVPLALKVLGCLLYGKTRNVWERTLERLERIPNSDIEDVLRVSYDGLEEDQRDIFLDLACFFKGEDLDFVISVLDDNGHHTETGIESLVDKSLVSVYENKIHMLDLVQEMGKEVVRQESSRVPGKRSRLWHHDDIYQVLATNSV